MWVSNQTWLANQYVLSLFVGYDVSLLIDLEKLPGSDKEKGE